MNRFTLRFAGAAAEAAFGEEQAWGATEIKGKWQMHTFLLTTAT